MRAIRLHAFGPAENLVHERTEAPVPAPGQVRIAVAAAGVHLLDTALRQGFQGPAPALPELPTIPGREVAGTVDALGPGTDPDWLGRQVVVHLGFAPGGYAEYAVADADRLHPLPPGLDAAEAVAMIGTGRTTLGILQFADLGPDSVALVPAAAGGIGTLLVQYALRAGATVIALAGGPAKTALAAANGADLALDYTAPGWTDAVRRHHPAGATVLFDSVGGPTARAALGLLAPGARHIVFGWSGGPIPLTDTDRADLAARNVTTHNVLGPEMLRRAGGDNPLRLLETRALAEAAAGRLRPALQRYPLAEAAAAHHALETRATTGKVVLEP
ncbi:MULTISPECIES: zinc-binding dehydrogenase [unclassified Streptomyces]|uniref:zinc-binding dehydrogenase n=1 Tax=unclassified Streptomyces TaxID=2593676 RepID=UPI00225070F1|nr:MULTISPECIES: zinc-binding dehydrogenase [unclassified Streptomyces]MCX5147017.1 zinc-binding dehydrogenase [Streptomyces sp. NBC_00320]WSN53750.1 zinc-binding dehydrogenase [Streptomyces sp. NBC_01296]WSW64023.1 zinc-binding dehydrogenase [Streptomyces sp. NBC_00998]